MSVQRTPIPSPLAGEGGREPGAPSRLRDGAPRSERPGEGYLSPSPASLTLRVRSAPSPARGLLRKGAGADFATDLRRMRAVPGCRRGGFWALGSCCGQTPAGRAQHQHAAQVEADREQRELQLIADQTEITGAAEAVDALENRKYRFDPAADLGQRRIVPPLLRRERMMLVGPMHDAVSEAKLCQQRAPAMGIVGFVGIDRAAV